MNVNSLVADAGNVITNRFLLSRVLTKRIRQLNGGAKPKVEVEDKTPSMEIALQEIIEKKLEITGIADFELQS